MRLIDADALDEKLQALKERYAKQGRIEAANDFNFVATVIMTAPTIEAVEVVRCKDCEMRNDFDVYMNGKPVLLCGVSVERNMGALTNHIVNPNHYCGYGRRRADDGEDDCL